MRARRFGPMGNNIWLDLEETEEGVYLVLVDVDGQKKCAGRICCLQHNGKLHLCSDIGSDLLMLDEHGRIVTTDHPRG